MKDKDKYRAQIEARLMEFGESLYDITNKMEQRKTNQPNIKITPILKKQEAAEDKLKKLDRADEDSWRAYQAELDELVVGIDEDLRKAMAYFG
jgi:hypothetical protein